MSVNLKWGHSIILRENGSQLLEAGQNQRQVKEEADAQGKAQAEKETRKIQVRFYSRRQISNMIIANIVLLGRTN